MSPYAEVWTALIAVSLGCIATSNAAPGEQGTTGAAPIYLDPSEQVEQRVDDLVDRMTLEEKAAQMVNGAAAIPRLQVPEYNWWSEALHGLMVFGRPVTVFPEPIGLAASFNSDLIHEMAVATGNEGRAYYNIVGGRDKKHHFLQGLTFFAPNINIFRDPRWGRGQETYGEDPWLTGKLAVAYITGLQGDDPHYLRAGATAKHFAVYSGPEYGRLHFDAKVSPHDLEDTYLPAFRDAVVEGKVRSVMCDYYKINGVPACVNEFLLTDILRKRWKFDGFVVSDCGAVTNINTTHRYLESPAAARAAAVRAGLDNECTTTPIGGSETEVQAYLEALKTGKLSEADLDVSLQRTFTTRFKLGMFDPDEQVKYAQTPKSVLNSDAHAALALQTARESMVLLKNDGVLPLNTSLKKIAVFGTLADQKPVLYGNYSSIPSKPVTALAGIQQQFGTAEVVYEPGTDFNVEAMVVPAEVLRTNDGTPGLTAMFFDNDAMTGAPLATRIDAQVSVRPNFGGRDELARAAARWSGWLVPKESGTYKLGLRGGSNVLYFEGKPLVDARGLHVAYTDVHEVELVAGKRYAIAVESPKTPFRNLELVWSRNVPKLQLDARIAKAIDGADVAIAVVGITSELEGEETGRDNVGFKGGDRTLLDLPKEQQDMLETIKATGKPLIVVLMNGSALSVNWADKQANAILEAWYPGQAGGTAIAETLAGLNNPAGRLPVTFYKGVEQLPPIEDYSMAQRTYRYFSGKPLYPFGFGLSYSTFSYSGLQLSSKSLQAGSSLTVTAQVKNTSTRAGDEVVQLYLTFPKVPGAPIRALRGFTRVHLAAGESKPVQFELTPRDLSYVNEDGERLVGAGHYRISVGGGQPITTAPKIEGAVQIVGRQLIDP